MTNKTKFGIVGWITYKDIPLSEQLLFGGATFGTFEEAWEHIYATDPEPEEGSAEWRDHWYDDYFVVEL